MPNTNGERGPIPLFSLSGYSRNRQITERLRLTSKAYALPLALNVVWEPPSVYSGGKPTTVLKLFKYFLDKLDGYVINA